MILVISSCKEKLSELEFVEPLRKIVGKCTVKHYSQITKKDIENADKIIISGTALKDFDYLNADWSWIKNFEKPILGICAGMQVVALAHGSKLVDFTTIGPQIVEVVKENELCSGTFNAYFLHTKTAEGMDVLATMNKKPAIVKKGNHYGVIFHPEVMNEDIINKFIL